MLKKMYIYFLFLPYSLAYDYCNLKCEEGPHTVCLRKGCEPSPVCENFEMIGMDDVARQLVLDLHNDYRNQLALGKDTRGGNSMAADMRALSYHKELEFVAQCYANACREMGAHDKCRITEQFDPVGQNLFILTASKTFDFTNLKWIKNGVKDWYNEITDVDAPVIDKYEKRPNKIGHFTQVVWAKTTHIGCGRVTYGHGLKRTLTLYCNYGIGGNVLGDKVYVRGKPCSQCWSNKCNDKYKGLCGDIEPLPNTTIGFVPKDIDKTTISSMKKTKDKSSDSFTTKYNFLVIFACITCIILLSLG
ncbi:hypothetical protein FQA39_LY09640 [Lamprigera yunnana]|nr:hypothetical protein FQA39_LY09640 [Lamprigera yunnana]